MLFRSTRELSEYFNRTFKRLLPKDTEEQSRFEEIPLPEASEGEFQGVFTYTASTAKNAAPYDADPAKIAGIITELMGNEKYLVRDEKTNELREIRPGDFMVITGEKKLLEPIMAELHARGIPTRTEGAVLFDDNVALIRLADIFRAVAEKDNTVALMKALTTPPMGL